MSSIIDSYEQFFELIEKEKFMHFWISNIKTIPFEKSITLWTKLKQDVANRNSELFVRDFGRNAGWNILLKGLYEEVFGMTINFDPTNNSKPTKLIEEHTGYKKNVDILNYQVSHVFGRTKNVYCFTAPWNIAYLPKIVDPFTGHEAKWMYVNEFKLRFHQEIFSRYEEQIVEYNQLMNDKKKEIENWLNWVAMDAAKKRSVLENFSEIRMIW